MLTTNYGSSDKKGEFRYSFDGKPAPRLQVIAQGLRRTVDRLTDAGKIVVLVEDNSSYKGLKIEKCLVTCTRSRALATQDNLPVAKLYSEARRRKPNLVLVLETLPVLCPSQTCSIRIGSVSMYRDTAHLSVEGSNFVMERFIPRLAATAAQHSILRGSQPALRGLLLSMHKDGRDE